MADGMAIQNTAAIDVFADSWAWSGTKYHVAGVVAVPGDVAARTISVDLTMANPPLT